MKILDIEDMRKAHKFANDNLWYLHEEQECVCIYCLSRFNSKDIEDYYMDDTACCPVCWVDGVIGEKSGYSFDDDEARMMHDFFFKNSGGVSEHILDLELLDKFKDIL